MKDETKERAVASFLAASANCSCIEGLRTINFIQGFILALYCLDG